jgi:hypothetical protein
MRAEEANLDKTDITELEAAIGAEKDEIAQQKGEIMTKVTGLLMSGYVSFDMVKDPLSKSLTDLQLASLEKNDKGPRTNHEQRQLEQAEQDADVARTCLRDHQNAVRNGVLEMQRSTAVLNNSSFLKLAHITEYAVTLTAVVTDNAKFFTTFFPTLHDTFKARLALSVSRLGGDLTLGQYGKLRFRDTAALREANTHLLKCDTDDRDYSSKETQLFLLQNSKLHDAIFTDVVK